MKEVFAIDAIIGKYAINHGSFMEGDGRSRKYSLWCNGSCIYGGTFTSLKHAKKTLTEAIRSDMLLELNKLEERTADMRIFLRNLDCSLT